MSYSLLPRLTYAPLRAFRNVTAAIILLVSPVYAETTVLALGDSLTAGYGLPTDQGFVPQLQAWLAAKGTDVQILNAGVSGDTTAGGLSRTDWSLTPEVDAVIVNLGGNDMLRGIDPATSRANLDAILAKVQARGLPVLLVSLRAPGNYGEAFKTNFDAMYPDLATKYGALLAENYFFPVINQQTRLLDPEYMQADGIHPNAKGVAKILEAVGPKVQELLARVTP
ncbi:arylesterase [Cypionkella sp.]|uniref:arylesterase n=1 Tax=Cypionkella sp. TaxID=2811411 RepID=UPI00260EC184|nr:arylesterase [Cypionkella sp.]